MNRGVDSYWILVGTCCMGNRPLLVGPSWHICINFYGEKTIIGRAMAIPALPEPTPMMNRYRVE